jgi:ribosome maturation protein SDO1
MTLESSVIARYSKGGEHFEILVDPKGAEDFKSGTNSNLNEILEIDNIFKDAHKGDKANTDSIKKIFGTEDVMAVAEKILKDGEIQLTTDQRKEMVEQRRQRVVQAICRDAVDPQTMKPHPPERIKNALEQAHFNIDLHKRFEDQVEEAIKLLRPIIPIRLEKLRVAVRVPADYAPKAYQHLHHFEVQKEEWQKDGSLVAVIEIPAGLQDELFGELNSFTHGNVETRILKDE